MYRLTKTVLSKEEVEQIILEVLHNYFLRGASYVSVENTLVHYLPEGVCVEHRQELPDIIKQMESEGKLVTRDWGGYIHKSDNPQL